MLRGARLCSIALLWAVGACSSTPTMPEGAGNGLLSWDRDPPAGVGEVVAAPKWKAGDRYAFRRGGIVDLDYRVAKTDRGYELRPVDGGVAMQLAGDLAMVGQVDTGERPDPRVAKEFAPADPLFHWPLWVGKRWTVSILRKQPGRPPLPLEVSYEVEAHEPCKVPAGEFDSYRIRRSATIAGQREDVLERTSLYWYSPAAGFYVRQLAGSTLVELKSFQRQ